MRPAQRPQGARPVHVSLLLRMIGERDVTIVFLQKESAQISAQPEQLTEEVLALRQEEAAKADWDRLYTAIIADPRIATGRVRGRRTAYNDFDRSRRLDGKPTMSKVVGPPHSGRAAQGVRPLSQLE